MILGAKREVAGEKAGVLLDRALRGGQPGPMAQAVLRAKKLNVEWLESRLVAALTSPDPVVRGMAGHGLGMLSSPRTLPSLAHLLMHDPDATVRAHAVDSIARIGGEEGLKALCDAVCDPSLEVKVAAISALAHFSGSQVANLVATYLTDPTPALRAAAISALAGQRGAHATEQCNFAMNDSDALVRRSAAYALGTLRSASAVLRLTEALSDPGMEVGWAAAHALGEIGDPTAVGPLVDSLRRFGDPYTKQEIARALGKIGGRDAAAALEESLADPSEHVRKAAVEALARLRSS